MNIGEALHEQSLGLMSQPEEAAEDLEPGLICARLETADEGDLEAEVQQIHKDMRLLKIHAYASFAMAALSFVIGGLGHGAPGGGIQGAGIQGGGINYHI